jgi:hypothetical protein
MAPVWNRPGLPALSYRLATHGGFFRRMLNRLPGQRVGPGSDDPEAARPLAPLTARTPDDPAIALLDAWATVGDVLTFYQERIANEGFLRTATERRSVLELARGIGYELNPGVAASTYLAFTVEDAKGAPGSATVDVGTKVLSIPGQGQRPQTFETIERIEARAEWNALRPRTSAPQPIVAGLTELYLTGLAVQLRPGDPILLVGQERARRPRDERWDVRTVTEVTTDAGRELTRVRWDRPLGEPQPGSTTAYRTLPASDRPQAYALRLRAALFGHNAPDWRAMPLSTQLAYALPNALRSPGAIQNLDTRTLPDQWPGFTIGSGRTIDIDGDHPEILPGSWLVLSRPGWAELYRATTVVTTSRGDFTLSGKVTRVGLDTTEHLSRFPIRNTVVLARSEELEIGEAPILEPLAGATIVLDQLVDGLAEEQVLAVSGQRACIEVRVAVSLVPADGSAPVAIEPGGTAQVLRLPDPSGCWQLVDRRGITGFARIPAGAYRWTAPADDDEVIREIVTVKQLPPSRDRTTIVLSLPLAGVYARTTVSINANVARATHGETVHEVLGGGDGAAQNQRFTLRKPPLTYVSARTVTGGESTLTVRVNGVRWHEAVSLYGLDPTSRSYIVRLDDDTNATVIFGDGQSGARLPSGQENVEATYRSGIGPEGEVGAGALTLLQIRPHGVRGVENPVPAAGAPPEALADARQNAPLTVVTMDRIVSLSDFADFARAFAGIGKALAVAVWNGQVRVVRLVVAGQRGEQVLPMSSTYQDLVAGIDRLRDPLQPFEVVPYRRRTFRLAAFVLVGADLLPDAVAAAVRERLRAGFSFDARAFGQPVTAAEVIAAVQSVDGVVMVDLQRLTLDPAMDLPVTADPCVPPPATAAATAAAAATTAAVGQAGTPPAILAVAATDVLVIDPAGIDLTLGP